MSTARKLRPVSLLTPSLVIFTCMSDPNVRREYTFGFRPYQASYGVIPSNFLVGDLFRMNTTVVTASPQNVSCIDLFFSMHRVIACIVWLRFSTALLCYSKYGAMRCLD